MPARDRHSREGGVFKALETEWYYNRRPMIRENAKNLSKTIGNQSITVDNGRLTRLLVIDNLTYRSYRNPPWFRRYRTDLSRPFSLPHQYLEGEVTFGSSIQRQNQQNHPASQLLVFIQFLSDRIEPEQAIQMAASRSLC